MGLDMYLEKKTYVKNWSHMQPWELHKITVRRGGKIRKDIDPKRISHIIEQVAYWRKANQINKWFIDHCADGNDDNGGQHYVSIEQLHELVDTCKEVLAASKLVKGKIANGYTLVKGKEKPIMVDGSYIEDAAVAKEKLPTSGGFFFGSTEYDEYYIEDLKETIKQLEPLLAEKDEGDYYYHNSW